MYVLHTYRRVTQLTVKIKSNSRTHDTHTHLLPLVHFVFLNLSVYRYLTRALTMKAIEQNHCRWQFSAMCLNGGVGGYFNRRQDQRRCRRQRRVAASHTTSCSGASASAASVALSHSIPNPDAVNGVLSAPRAAFAVHFQCEMKSRG